MAHSPSLLRIFLGDLRLSSSFISGGNTSWMLVIPPLLCDSVVIGSYPLPNQYIHTYKPQSYNKKDPWKHPPPEVLQILGWPLSMLGIYVLAKIQWQFWHIVHKCRVQFQMQCIIKEAIRSIKFVAMLVPLVWLASPVSVGVGNINSNPRSLCNPISKNHL